jgi:phosphate transport system substrate-binding protein
VPVAALALITSACGGDDDDSGASSDVKGSVTVSGSSTVEPITSLVGELFNETNPDVSIRVDGPGTGDGFQLFCNGDIDLADASREIKDEEAQTCKDKGIEYTALKVGIDGISVITAPDNDDVDCVSFADLYALVGPESEGFEKWSDANALDEEVGGKGDLPDVDLSITAPGEESGTYDSFIEIALKDIAEQRVADGKITEDEATTVRKDYSSQANDNTIIEGVAGDATSLGWVGFSYADQNNDKVKLLQVDGGDGCVEATAETIGDGSYPLSRPLFIYVNNTRASKNAAVKAFVDYYMTDDGALAVEEADYIPLPDDEWQKSVDTWAGAEGAKKTQ